MGRSTSPVGHTREGPPAGTVGASPNAGASLRGHVPTQVLKHITGARPPLRAPDDPRCLSFGTTVTFGPRLGLSQPCAHTLTETDPSWLDGEWV